MENKTDSISVIEQYVQLKGFKLFTRLYGNKTGNPIVVMEAGYGDDSKSWASIIPEVSRMSQVLVYDRAGLGKSEQSPNPRTSEEMVNELHEMLAKLSLEPPYILVGHSFGGVNMRLYAVEFPSETAGMVLIDSTPEEYRERFLPNMPEDFQEAYNKQFVHEGTYDEFMESLMQLKYSSRYLKDIPLIVLSAGKKDHYSMEAQLLWHEMQKEIAGLSIQGEFIIAADSAHYIQKDEPMVVIEAIAKLLGN